MKQTRPLIEIDEALCDGCGICLPSCHEGALKIVDGKARLVSDALCDGLGACLQHCPRGALRVMEREAEPFDMAAAGWPAQATASAEEASPRTRPPKSQAHVAPAHPGSPARPGSHDLPPSAPGHPGGGCPGSRVEMFGPAAAGAGSLSPSSFSGGPGSAPRTLPAASQLSHWPVQIRLVPPTAPFLQGASLLVAADCVPVAMAGFHQELLAGRAVMIGCPKFDDVQDAAGRFARLFRESDVRSVVIAVMDVPCCFSLPTAVINGLRASGRTIEAELVVVGTDGTVRERRPLL